MHCALLGSPQRPYETLAGQEKGDKGAEPLLNHTLPHALDMGGQGGSVPPTPNHLVPKVPSDSSYIGNGRLPGDFT